VPPTSIEPGEAHASYAPARVQRRLANAEAGEARYQQALALQVAGLRHKEVGQRLGVSGRTIGRWLSQGRGPATQRRRKKPSQLDRFVPYMLHRWAEGCRNGTVLQRELAARGYTGGARTVYKFPASAYAYRHRHLLVRRRFHRCLHLWMASRPVMLSAGSCSRLKNGQARHKSS
jgi:hypothetical protein